MAAEFEFKTGDTPANWTYPDAPIRGFEVEFDAGGSTVTRIVPNSPVKTDPDGTRHYRTVLTFSDNKGDRAAASRYVTARVRALGASGRAYSHWEVATCENAKPTISNAPVITRTLTGVTVNLVEPAGSDTKGYKAHLGTTNNFAIAGTSAVEGGDVSPANNCVYVGPSNTFSVDLPDDTPRFLRIVAEDVFGYGDSIFTVGPLLKDSIELMLEDSETIELIQDTIADANNLRAQADATLQQNINTAKTLLEGADATIAANLATQTTRINQAWTALGTEPGGLPGGRITSLETQTGALNTSTQAAASSIQALTAVVRAGTPFILPSGFETASLWTASADGDPATRSDTPYAVVSDTDFGKALAVTGSASSGGLNIYAKGVVPVVGGRAYEVEIAFKPTTLPTGGSMAFGCAYQPLDGAYAAVGSRAVVGLTGATSPASASDTVQRGTFKILASSLPAGTKYVRVGVSVHRSGVGSPVTRLGLIGVRDVTERDSANASILTLHNTTSDLQTGKAGADRVTLLEGAINTAGTGLLARTTAAETAIVDLTTNKAAASRVDTLEARSHRGDGLALNPNFSNWTGTYPVGFSNYGASQGFSKETAITSSGGNAMRFTISDATANAGASFQNATSFKGSPDHEWLVVTTDVYLVSGGFGGAGILIDGSTSSGGLRLSIPFLTEWATSPIGTWLQMRKLVRRPVRDANFVSYRGYLMTNYNGNGLGTRVVKDIIIDRFDIRPATQLEIDSQRVVSAVDSGTYATDARVSGIENTITTPTTGLAAKIGALETTINTPTTGLSAKVASQQQAITDLETGKATASDVDALEAEVTGARGTAASVALRFTNVESDIAGKASSTDVSSLSSTVSLKNRTFRQGTQPTNPMDGLPLVAGDTWINSSANNFIKAWSGSAWVDAHDTQGAGAAAEIGVARNGSANLAAQLATMRQTVTDGLSGKVSTTDFNTATSEITVSRGGFASLNARLNATDATVDGKASSLALSTLSSTVNTKPQTFAQASAPSSTGRITGDLWADTDDNNQLYRWSGSAWVSVHDVRGESALAAINDAKGSSTTLNARITGIENTATTDRDAAAISIGQLQASVSPTAINANPTFLMWNTAGTVPTGWAAFNGGSGTTTRVAGSAAGPWAVRQVSDGTGDFGLQLTPYAAGQTGGSWVVVECTVKLIAGSMRGAGLRLYTRTSGGSTITPYDIDFAEDFSNMGTAPGGGTTGKSYTFTKMFDVRGSTVAQYQLYPLARHSAFSPSGAVTIEWQSASVRNATLSEIQSGDVGALAATVTTLQDAVATLDGETRARWAIGTAVPGATAFIEARAETTAGQTPTSSVAIGARVFSIYNDAGGGYLPALTVAGGNAIFNGQLTAGAGVLVGSGQIPVALQAFTRSAVDGGTISFGTNLGQVPSYSFSTSNLLPLEAGEVYALSLSNLTSTGGTVYAKIRTPGTPAAITLTTDASASGGPTRQINRGSNPEAVDYTYTVTASGTATFRYLSVNNREYELNGQVNVGVWSYKSSTWTKVGTMAVPVVAIFTGSGSGYQTYGVNWEVGQDFLMPSGTTYFGVGLESHTIHAATVSDLDSVSWTTAGSPSGTRTALASGAKASITFYPRNGA